MAELKPTLVTSACLSPVSTNGSSCLLTKKQSLYPCTISDAVVSTVGESTLLASFSPVAVYGSVGFVSLSLAISTPTTRPLWKQCVNVCYCDGPSFEGDTLGYLAKYQTRWFFRFDSGFLYYGVVGTTEVRLLTLFPTTVEYDSFSACFDQNAKPVVVFCSGTTIELRRTQADLVTSHSFSGESPVLFLNALLQSDLNQQDVVCYYLRTGNLCGRWQRDNFAVEYILVESVDVDSLFSVRAFTAKSNPREFIFCQKTCSTRILISDSYLPWPLLIQDTVVALVGLVSDGDYFPIITTASSTDLITSMVDFLADGDYQPVTIVETSSDSVTGTASFSSDGDYTPESVTVTTTTSDSLSGTTLLLSDGDYYESAVSGGSYSDSPTATAAFSTDGSYTI